MAVQAPSVQSWSLVHSMSVAQLTLRAGAGGVGAGGAATATGDGGGAGASAWTTGFWWAQAVTEVAASTATASFLIMSNLPSV